MTANSLAGLLAARRVFVPAISFCVSVLGLAGVPRSALAEFTPIGPTPYLSFADSPFNGMGLAAFHLDDMEDGAFNVPGVTAISNTPGTTMAVAPPSFATDSVDGDDGVIDGLGRDGYSLGNYPNVAAGDLGFTFVFDPVTLGALPTHVGLVWTDGSPSAPTQVEFFGPADELLGTIGPVHISDDWFSGETGEDRFFGAISASGISRLVIRDIGSINGLEIDHFQYGMTSAPPARLGDFSGDGVVDQADYTTWADNYGLSTAAFAYGSRSPMSVGPVNQGDYTTWADNFGQAYPAVVPEPAAMSLLAMGALAMLKKRAVL